MNKYWVVGAMWGGIEDVLNVFLKRGYWYCWDPKINHESSSDVGNSIGVQQERFKQIKTGDRIAVKKMLGQGSKEIEICALGVVKDVDVNEWHVYVTWLTDESFSRKVPIKGYTASGHGPLEQSETWIKDVFCI